MKGEERVHAKGQGGGGRGEGARTGMPRSERHSCCEVETDSHRPWQLSGSWPSRRTRSSDAGGGRCRRCGCRLHPEMRPSLPVARGRDRQTDRRAHLCLGSTGSVVGTEFTHCLSLDSGAGTRMYSSRSGWASPPAVRRGQRHLGVRGHRAAAWTTAGSLLSERGHAFAHVPQS